MQKCYPHPLILKSMNKIRRIDKKKTILRKQTELQSEKLVVYAYYNSPQSIRFVVC